MSDLSDYLETALLNAVLRNTTYTSPATVYLALFTSPTTDAGGGTEVSGGSYARQSVAFSAPADSSGSMQCSNSADVTFPIATANWGTVTHAALCDASSGGHYLWHGALSVSRTVNTNDQIKFEAGDLKSQLA